LIEKIEFSFRLERAYPQPHRKHPRSSTLNLLSTPTPNLDPLRR
jgi:hypothetical protein